MGLTYRRVPASNAPPPRGSQTFWQSTILRRRVAARRSLSHFARLRGRVRERRLRRCDRFASGGIFYLTGMLARQASLSRWRCCLLDPSLAVPSTSTFSHSRHNSTGCSDCWYEVVIEVGRFTLSTNLNSDSLRFLLRGIFRGI